MHFKCTTWVITPDLKYSHLSYLHNIICFFTTFWYKERAFNRNSLKTSLRHNYARLTCKIRSNFGTIQLQSKLERYSYSLNLCTNVHISCFSTSRFSMLRWELLVGPLLEPIVISLSLVRNPELSHLASVSHRIAPTADKRPEMKINKKT